MTLLATIQKYGPLTTTELWDDIVAMRLASPCEDLPATEAELARELLRMRLEGELSQLPGDKWQPVRQRVKAEARLF